MKFKLATSTVSILIGLALVILLSSCCLFSVNDYDVVFRNIGTHNLYVTSGIIGNYVPPVGTLNPDIYKGSISHSGIPDSVKIRWKKG